jgi:hypothetical protein
LHKKVKLSEEKAARGKIMGELLSPLGRENRAVMQEILANVKTGRLQEAFKKHLPAVLNETRRAEDPRRSLSESHAQNNKSVITGNRAKKNTNETTVVEESCDTAEIVRLQKLAGVSGNK